MKSYLRFSKITVCFSCLLVTDPDQSIVPPGWAGPNSVLSPQSDINRFHGHTSTDLSSGFAALKDG